MDEVTQLSLRATYVLDALEVTIQEIGRDAGGVAVRTIYRSLVPDARPLGRPLPVVLAALAQALQQGAGDLAFAGDELDA